MYGTLVSTWSARIEIAGEAPLTLITWIGSDLGLASPLLQRLSGGEDTSRSAISARVTGRDGQSVFLLRDTGATRVTAGRDRVLDFETDARALHYGIAGERLVSLDLVDARQATTPRPGWISIESDEPVADLHLGIGEGTLDLRASVPPSRLRVRGTAGFHTVRLNGRALPLSAAAPSGFLLIHGADWRDSTPGTPLSHPRPLPVRVLLSTGARPEGT